MPTSCCGPRCSRKISSGGLCPIKLKDLKQVFRVAMKVVAGLGWDEDMLQGIQAEERKCHIAFSMGSVWQVLSKIGSTKLTVLLSKKRAKGFPC